MKFGMLLMACAVAAQAETQVERGKKLIDEVVAALGGQAFLSMQDRVEDGRAYSFYRERLSGLARAKISTRYLSGEQPGKVAQRERQAFGKDEDYLNLFTEDRAYQITFRGAKPMPDERWERYYESTRRNIFYLLRHRLKEPGMIFEYRGLSVWQNNPVEQVDITDAENNVVSLYVHRSTKLPLRQVYVRRDPKTKLREEYSSVFSKYRDVGGGVQWPYNIMSERNGEKTFEMFSDTVAINQGLDDSLFLLNASTKVLPEDK